MVKRTRTIVFLRLIAGCIVLAAGVVAPQATTARDIPPSTFAQLKVVPTIGEDGTIYFASSNAIHAVNPDGSLKWKCGIEGTLDNGIAIGADGTVYCSAEGVVFAIDPDGKFRDKLEMPTKLAAPPVVGANGNLFAVFTGSGLYVIKPDFSTKAKIFSLPSRAQHRISSLVTGGDGLIYFCLGYGKGGAVLYGVNPDITERRNFKLEGSNNYSSPSVGPDGTVFIVGGTAWVKRDRGTIGYRGIQALNPDGTVMWALPLKGGLTYAPTIGADGVVYCVGGKDHDQLFAINPDGTKKWVFHIRRKIKTSPTIGLDGNIYVVKDTGELYIVDPSGAIIGECDNGGGVSSTPAVGQDGTVYFLSSRRIHPGHNMRLIAMNPAGEIVWVYDSHIDGLSL